VYIPTNRNRNQRRSAIVTFASEKEMKTAQTKPIRFNNHLLFWQGETKKRKQNEEEEEVYEKHIIAHDVNINLDTEVYENKSNREEEDTEEYNENKKKHHIYSTRKENSQARSQDLLEKILERLERLEAQQNKTRWKIEDDLPNHS
jgi:hypothetical protein